MRHARKVLAVSMLIMGACGLIYEYTLGALGNNLIGSSHEQIYIIIGLMLFAMGLGAYFQKAVNKDLIDKFLLLEIALGLFGGFSAIVIYAAFAYTLSYKLALWGFAMLIGTFIGMEIPILLRINTEYAKDLKANLSDILCMDYIGSLIGAFLFTYVLITNLSIERIAITLGVVNILIALFGIFYFWHLIKYKNTITFAAVASLLLLLVLSSSSPTMMNTFEQRTYQDPIVYSGTSKYQHITMTMRNDKLKFFINGHLQFSSSDEHIYHEMLVHVPMAVARNRRKVLILGGGDGLALREILKYPDVTKVTLVDLDPFITEIASENPELIRLNQGSLFNPRVEMKKVEGIEPGEEAVVNRKSQRTSYRLADVNVINVDADIFLRTLEDKYDIVIIDFPDPRSIELSKLYSVDFYRTLRSSLLPGAIITIQSSSPYHARKVFLSVRKSLQKAGYTTLPYHQNIPSFGEWGWNLAWIGDLTEEEMQKKLSNIEIDVGTRYVDSRIVYASTIFSKEWLNEKDVRHNTKMQPVMPKYYREAWRN